MSRARTDEQPVTNFQKVEILHPFFYIFDTLTNARFFWKQCLTRDSEQTCEFFKT